MSYDSFVVLVHYYNYILDGWDKNVYRKTRFASEYGYQSLPSFETLKSATNNSEDLKYNSDFMHHRQHLPGGVNLLTSLINKQMKLPSADKTEYFKTYVYYSQVYMGYYLLGVPKVLFHTFSTTPPPSTLLSQFIRINYLPTFD